MKELFLALLIMCICASACYMSNAFYPNDKNSREKIRNFIFIKGIFYFLIAILTFLEEIVNNNNYSMLVLFTICVSIFETSQNIIQIKADNFIEKANRKLKDASTKDCTLKNIEKLYMYCSEQLDFIRREPTEDREQLVYEKIYDYLKYYKISNEFFNKFNEYRNRKCDLDEVYNALDRWKNDMDYYALEIVKLPEY